MQEDDAAKDMHCVRPAAALSDEKKNMFWMGGMMDCFSTVFSVFGRSELKSAKGLCLWYYPYA